MPFAHIKNKAHDLILPHPIPYHYQEVMWTLIQDIPSELHVLEPGHTGDLVPDYWERLGNINHFMISVAPKGEEERAHIVIENSVMGNPQPLKGIPGIEDPLDAAHFDDEMWVDKNVLCALVSFIPEHQRHINIGGMVLFMAPGGLKVLQDRHARYQN